MKHFKRVFLIVIDSLGIGEMQDSGKYGDSGADTLGHIDAAASHLSLPNLERLGLGSLHKLSYVRQVHNPLAYTAKLNEASIGKDTMTGHWEMTGLYITKPFITFTDMGFPKELLDELSKKTGHGIIGNKSASGTEIMDELGQQHIATGDMIVYTSADSVLQICANEETFGLDELYRCCEIARELTMRDDRKVGRVIARPFIGLKKGEFKRTANRHDYALKPFGTTALDLLKEAGLDVIGIGKINDIFDGQGITAHEHSKSSIEGMEQTIAFANNEFEGLCFTNLVDFDALWGHRRNPIGYGNELESFDVKLGELLPLLKEDDLLILTADHGNDPTFHGSDHTREKVPFLAYSKAFMKPQQLPEQASFGVIGATVLDNFNIEKTKEMIGVSVLKNLI